MFKAVLFDLDQTLLDRKRTFRHFIEDQYQRQTVLQQIPYDLFVKDFTVLDDNGYGAKDRAYHAMLKKYGLDTGLTDMLYQDFRGNYALCAQPYPDTHEVLQAIRDAGLKIGIVTNGVTETQKTKLDVTGIGPFADTVLVSEEEGIKKPNPEIFHRALKRIGHSAAETVFVGDHPENDVRAAQGVGMKAILKLDGDEVDTSFANHVVSDLRSLLPLIL
ncbi:HAD family hydrolase [Deinococcus cellulosilyticus]|uniref:Haloacid dehalogenase n=1 Tax=Deinococcus cellulosilyticus (strain DSM 18568 / NBRC 106333 / KACC 11606 / 5516J-15) TaxID=1223518 RepID=A0A511N7T6_DEIC1|nr:HAD family hydrolase [Deinococcus cellulosilyticus]GEM48899.1 haloacid dehalogenase [Deinococcus cellulosilyticus NBRC 106333 = KACC 11606]